MKRKLIMKSRLKYYYRVTLTFADGSTQDDIALRSASADAAREYVAYRAEEWESKPSAIAVKRISQAEAEDIINSNGIDWAT